MELTDEIFLWLEKHNPLLARETFPIGPFFPSKKTIELLSDTEVCIIQGVDCLPLYPVKGVKIVLIEENLSKIGSFLDHKGFLPHKDLYISTKEKEQLYPILQQCLFKKVQYEGDLDDVKKAMDELRMGFSEYRDLGEEIIPNILGNLIHIQEFIDGRQLKGLFLNQEAIVCGSGASLQEGIKEIQAMEHRPWIFSVGSSLPILIKEGIIPDFFVVIDPCPPLELYQCLQELSIPIFYQNRASKDLLYLHKGPKVFMGSHYGWEIENYLLKEVGIENFFFDGGFHAGNFGVHIALTLGCLKVTLLGMDGVAKEGEEVSLEKMGKKTRGDLYYGMDFFSLLAQHFPERTLYHYTQGFSFEGAVVINRLHEGKKKENITLPQGKKILIERVEKVLETCFNHPMLPIIEEGLSQIKGEEGNELLLACLEAELSLHPLYLHLCLPLWEVWKNLLQGEDDKGVAHITFVYTILKRCSQKTSKIEGCFSLLGKKEGLFERLDDLKQVRERGYYYNGLADGLFSTYDENGELVVTFEMKKGLRDGEYRVYKNMKIIREGRFYKGLCHGVHRCYIDGRVVDECCYEYGKKSGVHRIYTDEGIKIEEIEYKEGDFFDRYRYDDEGALIYSGIWINGMFEEERFDQGKQIFSRKGTMVENKIIFKECDGIID